MSSEVRGEESGVQRPGLDSTHSTVIPDQFPPHRPLLTPHVVRFLIVLFVFAFIVRLAFVLWLRDIHEFPRGPLSLDDYEFHLLASNVATGEGYVYERGRPTSFRAPGFPLFLAALYVVAGLNSPLAYVCFCLLGALSCVLTYFLAREFVSERSARIAGGLAPFTWRTSILLRPTYRKTCLCRS